jgi:hypothetical protein
VHFNPLLLRYRLLYRIPFARLKNLLFYV